MSMMYCEDCDKQIDTDYDVEHFEDHKENDEVERAIYEDRIKRHHEEEFKAGIL